MKNLWVASFGFIGEYLFAGTGGTGVYRSADNGATWSDAFRGLASYSVLALAVNGAKLFAGVNGYVCRSDDQAATPWTCSPVVTGKHVSSIFVRGSTLFAGTLGGGVYRSVDNGLSWGAVNAGLACLHINAVTGDGSSLFAAGSPDLFGGQFERGVYRSADNGASWVKVNNVYPMRAAFSLAVHRSDVFVGTDDGVYRTDVSGIGWTKVDTGMAQTTVLSLAIQEGYLLAGTESRGIWKIPLSQIPTAIGAPVGPRRETNRPRRGFGAAIPAGIAFPDDRRNEEDPVLRDAAGRSLPLRYWMK